MEALRAQRAVLRAAREALRPCLRRAGGDEGSERPTKRILLTAVLLLVSLAASAGETATILRVIDGDTLAVFDGDGEKTVRLLGIDTPEARPNSKAERDAEEWGVAVEAITRAGEKAKTFITAISPPGIEVAIVADGEDAYCSTLAYVYLPDGRCLNELLLRAGAALTPPRYRHVRIEGFAEMERTARITRQGFWKSLWKNL